MTEIKGKKVCFLTSVHPPFDTRIFHKEAKSLKDTGYDVVLVVQHTKNEVVDGIKIVPISKSKNRISRMIFTSWNILKKAKKEKADVYHLHDPELLPVGVVLKLLTRKKIIYDVHEDYEKQILNKHYLPKIIRAFIAKLVGFLEKIMSRFYDIIITATDDISNNFMFHKNVVTIRNLPVIGNFKEKIRNQTSINNGVFRPIYVGGLAEVRGVTQIVKTMDYINSDRQVQLILCGRFITMDYEKKITTLNGFKNVKYMDYVENKKIPSVLLDADVGLVCLNPISNYVDSLPTKLFEYMAAGLPVIASNFPLWKEIVDGNRCGLLVDPLNPREIAEAIEYLVENPDVCFEMGKNGRRAVEEKYNWENESKKLISLYQRLLNR